MSVLRLRLPLLSFLVTLPHFLLSFIALLSPPSASDLLDLPASSKKFGCLTAGRLFGLTACSVDVMVLGISAWVLTGDDVTENGVRRWGIVGFFVWFVHAVVFLVFGGVGVGGIAYWIWVGLMVARAVVGVLYFVTGRRKSVKKPEPPLRPSVRPQPRGQTQVPVIDVTCPTLQNSESEEGDSETESEGESESESESEGDEDVDPDFGGGAGGGEFMSPPPPKHERPRPPRDPPKPKPKPPMPEENPREPTPRFRSPGDMLREKAEAIRRERERLAVDQGGELKVIPPEMMTMSDLSWQEDEKE